MTRGELNAGLVEAFRVAGASASADREVRMGADGSAILENRRPSYPSTKGNCLSSPSTGFFLNPLLANWCQRPTT